MTYAMDDGIFDAHFHIIDPRFPLTPNQGFLPQPYLIEQYQKQSKDLSINKGALVSGSFQAFDQDYLISALKVLGPGFVGVTQLPLEVSNEKLHYLNQNGIKAWRFNLKRGLGHTFEEIKSCAHRIFDLVQWHVELYVDAQDLTSIQQKIITLPAVSIDHLGLSQSGLKTLFQLVEKGVKVKASGFGRVDFDVAKALKTIDSIDNNALMFGTDLPSTRAPRAFKKQDIDLIVEALGADSAKRVLYKNACSFYRIPP